MNAYRYPRWPHVWAACSGTLALLFVAIDWMARTWGGASYLAPSHGMLWLSVAFGAAIGAIALAQMWLGPRSMREFYTEFLRLPVRERLRWRHQRWNLLYSGWIVLSIWGLLGWCWYNGVFALSAIFAMNAVMFTATPAWALPWGAPRVAPSPTDQSSSDQTP